MVIGIEAVRQFPYGRVWPTFPSVVGDGAQTEKRGLICGAPSPLAERAAHPPCGRHLEHKTRSLRACKPKEIAMTRSGTLARSKMWLLQRFAIVICIIGISLGSAVAQIPGRTITIVV